MQALIFDEVEDLLKRVNRKGNKVKWTSDLDVWGERDKWAYPVEYKGRLSEDCDGISMYKYKLLTEEGISRDYLTLMICNTELGGGHMVLGVITDEGVMVLDNRNAYVTHWKGLADFGYKFRKRSTPGAAFDAQWETILPQ
jgi:predicted transglutaminase-like cysteine proteinase